MSVYRIMSLCLRKNANAFDEIKSVLENSNWCFVKEYDIDHETTPGAFLEYARKYGMAEQSIMLELYTDHISYDEVQISFESDYEDTVIISSAIMEVIECCVDVDGIICGSMCLESWGFEDLSSYDKYIIQSESVRRIHKDLDLIYLSDECIKTSYDIDEDYADRCYISHSTRNGMLYINKRVHIG